MQKIQRASMEIGSLMGPIVAYATRAGEGPQVAIVAGQHGDEGLGITAATALARVLRPRNGRILVVPCLNPAAAAAGERYAPSETGEEARRNDWGTDDPPASGATDLNRCWGGGRSREALHAHELLDGILSCDFALVLDLHATPNRPPSDQPAAWVYAPSADLAAELVPGVPSEVVPYEGTLMDAMTRAGVRCLTVEVDEDALTRGEAMRAYLWIVVRALASVGLEVDVQWASWRWR